MQAAGVDDVTDALDASPESLGAAGDPGAGVSILVVDDHEEFRDIVKQVLFGETGFFVTGEAADGAAAVDWVRDMEPDIVLMDVAMPRLDGLEATRQIKALRPETRVLILTVYTDDSYRERARASGADAFLAKQDAIPLLAPTIRRLLSGAA